MLPFWLDPFLASKFSLLHFKHNPTLQRDGMERKDLLAKNAAIFREQGKALNDYAARHVKVYASEVGVVLIFNVKGSGCWQSC